MAEEERKGRKEEDNCAHPLMCAEEWRDPEGAKVIGEYHKDEPSDEERIEEDLDAFERYWQRKHGINFQGEYHKEGAPYMEKPSGWEGHQPRSGFGGGFVGATPQAAEGPSTTVTERSPEPIIERSPPLTSAPPGPEVGRGGEGASLAWVGQPDLEAKGKGEPLRLTEVVDINTLEVVSYWIFRLAFGRELHIPIKKEGLADIDVHISNKDVVVNTNQLYFAFPELVVWHITYAHRGRPILEIGRGVKKGMKVHRLNTFRLLMEVWMGSRRSEREARAKGSKGTVAGSGKKSARAKDGQDLREKGDIT